MAHLAHYKEAHPLPFVITHWINLVAMIFLIILMFITGMCLWSTTANIPFFAAITAFFGGPMSIRIIHYFGMYVFIIFLFIHVHLATAEGNEPVKLMFLRKEHGGLVYDPDKHVIVGEDKMEHLEH